MQIQFFNREYPFFITWNDIDNVSIGDIILIKNVKTKVNGYIELFSKLIIRYLANNSRYLFEYSEFKRFVDNIKLDYTEKHKVTKKYFNSVPYFRFKILDIYEKNNENVLVLDPIDGNYE